MTNDYKEDLLKYLTGNITKGSKNDTPFYTDTETTSNTEITSIMSSISNYQINEVIDAPNGYFIAYGRYGADNTGYKGFMLILDSQMNPLELLTKYNTGTDFGQFFKLRVDEQGQLYGIDHYNDNFRVILLNNVSVKLPNQEHFVARLRNSYYLQGDVAEIQGVLDCVKSTASAKYFICGRDSSTELLLATEFQINVGSTNTWTNYTNSVSLAFLIYLSTLIYYDENDNVVLNIYFQDDTENNPIWQVKNNGTTITMSKVINSLYDYVVPNSTQLLRVDLLPVRANKFYFTVTSVFRDSLTYLGLRTWLYDNGETTNVFTTRSTASSTQASPPGYLYPEIKSKLVGTTPILTWCWVRDLDNPNYYDFLIAFLDTDVPILIDTDVECDWLGAVTKGMIAMSNTYNLYQIYFYSRKQINKWFLNKSKIVYNSNNYNGESYENQTSLEPRQGLIYDENNSLVFARNLYNKKVFSNQTISTINVPNSMLNDLTLGLKELYSSTNTKLTTDVESFTKNIYEDVYINFINSIYMENQNTDNYIDNVTGAIRLNNSSSRVLDYDDAKATKIRVTYDDDTYYITGASCTIDNNVGTYSIGIHVPNDKNVQSIEIISHDENTIYQTITNLNLENNKYYIITQDVYVV